MVLGLSLSATAGYALSRFKFPGNRRLMWGFLITQMFPVAILIVPIYKIFAKFGLLDTQPSLIIAYLHDRGAVLRLDAAGVLRHHPQRARRGGPAGRSRPVQDVLAAGPPPGPTRPGGDGVLHAHGVGRGGLRQRIHEGGDHKTLAAAPRSSRASSRLSWELTRRGRRAVTCPPPSCSFLAQRNLVAGLTAGGTKG